MAGLPRTVDDATIPRATAEVIGRAGLAGLTLAAVAREAGLSAATLVQRFGSKRGLHRVYGFSPGLAGALAQGLESECGPLGEPL
ncbi:MAG TPA: helix-turn-helix domain-containing protein [Streptosporangiaceae bacterium]|nr:helix-turn-helix domain-containing protein [Streptosporangiaceae bacterium]